MNVLVVDIGNTRAKWRLERFGTESIEAGDAADAPAASVPIADIARLADDWRGFAATPVAAAFVSNVAAAERAECLRAAVEGVWPAADVRIVSAATEQCGVVNGYRDATRLGADRWLALVAAHALEPNDAVLVCSFGTATTIDLLVPDGAAGQARFVGGLILPGFDAMRASLATSTARLPHARGDVVDFATSTDDAIASGVAAAQLGAVERALVAARARAPAPAAAAIACCLAGGGAAAVAALAATAAAFEPRVRMRLVPDLVLRGLATVASDTLLRERRRAPTPVAAR